MLRHQSLVPLSHQHQHGLALCVLIERELARDRSARTTARLARKVSELFDLELRNHFDVEEQVLFPALRGAPALVPMVEELIADHRNLEAAVGRIRVAGEGERAEALLAFTERLNTHIRREERELFEDAQKHLSPQAMRLLGPAIAGALTQVCLDDILSGTPGATAGNEPPADPRRSRH